MQLSGMSDLIMLSVATLNKSRNARARHLPDGAFTNLSKTAIKSGALSSCFDSSIGRTIEKSMAKF